MKTTLTLAGNLNCNIFDVFSRDTDEIIMLINFYIQLGKAGEKTINNNKTNKTQRIKVNDKTATGGWW